MPEFSAVRQFEGLLITSLIWNINYSKKNLSFLDDYKLTSTSWNHDWYSEMIFGVETSIVENNEIANVYRIRYTCLRTVLNF